MISRIACPNTISGPALNPRFSVSLIVTVNTGPGAIAPDRPTTNAPAKIVSNENMEYSLRDMIGETQ